MSLRPSVLNCNNVSPCRSLQRPSFSKHAPALCHTHAVLHSFHSNKVTGADKAFQHPSRILHRAPPTPPLLAICVPLDILSPLSVISLKVTRHTSHGTRHTSHVTRHTSHVTRHTSHVTRHTSHVTRHTSHLTPHTSHLTPHTLHVTPHTSHVTRQTTHRQPQLLHVCNVPLVVEVERQQPQLAVAVVHAQHVSKRSAPGVNWIEIPYGIVPNNEC